MLQNAGNDHEFVIREARIAFTKRHLRIESACAGILLRRRGSAHPVQGLCDASKMDMISARALDVLDLCRMSQAVGASADAKQRKRKRERR